MQYRFAILYDFIFLDYGYWCSQGFETILPMISIDKYIQITEQLGSGAICREVLRSSQLIRKLKFVNQHPVIKDIMKWMLFRLLWLALEILMVGGEMSCDWWWVVALTAAGDHVLFSPSPALTGTHKFRKRTFIAAECTNLSIHLSLTLINIQLYNMH